MSIAGRKGSDCILLVDGLHYRKNQQELHTHNRTVFEIVSCFMRVNTPSTLISGRFDKCTTPLNVFQII